MNDFIFIIDMAKLLYKTNFMQYKFLSIIVKNMYDILLLPWFQTSHLLVTSSGKTKQGV